MTNRVTSDVSFLAPGNTLDLVMVSQIIATEYGTYFDCSARYLLLLRSLLSAARFLKNVY